MKKIEEYTMDELSEKINAIKAEREKTANALKKYEEELERRNKEVPLGVPFGDKTLAEHYGVWELGFSSEESFRVFDEWFKDYVESLQKLARGEQIDINVLLPLLRKGKVLYSPYDEKWKWVEQEAIICAEEHGWYIKNSQVLPIDGFNIKPAENWEDSLMECGL